MDKPARSWMFAALLTLPMIALYAGYLLNHSPDLLPTGFIVYDNVSYVAYAKQLVEQPGFQLTYANPFNDGGHYPAIYFQPQTLVYALMLKAKMDSGWCIILFNLLGTLLSFRMVIALYDFLFPSQKGRLLFISLFCWGGGLLALAGVPVAAFKQIENLDFFDRIFFLDPAWGWWGLNFGRGHFPSSEGFYHFLFLAAVLNLLKRNWRITLLVALLLNASHPFTGITFLLVSLSWVLAESVLLRNRQFPVWFIISLAGLTLLHLAYYLVYLNHFPEHQSVSQQYALNWRLRYFSLLPAYCLVGVLTIYRFYTKGKQDLRSPSVRMIVAWWAVVTLLENHELFIQPIQPLHFTRGYAWAALFLLGLPILHQLYENALAGKRKLMFWILIALLFSDNALWIVNNIRFPGTTVSTSYITKEQRKVLDVLNQVSSNNTLLLSNDELLSYLTSVYTDAYPLYSHPFTTPFAQRKRDQLQRFLLTGETEISWHNKDLIFLWKHNRPDEAPVVPIGFGLQPLAKTDHYSIFRLYKTVRP